MKTLIVALAVGIVTALASSAQAGSDFSRSMCDIHYPSDDGIEWKCVKVKTGNAKQAFGPDWEEVLRFNRLDRRHLIAGKRVKVPVRAEEIRNFTPLPESYPEASGEEKFILLDQSESFLGAYEYGKLVFSMPAAVGMPGHATPNGEFRIDAVDRDHESDTYTMEGTDDTYPMHYGMRFLIDKFYWISYWIHGRDVPGHPASHGCVGLYDEEMQAQYYKSPRAPVLTDAKRLYEWVIGDHPDSGDFHKIDYGPRLVVIGEPPQ
ncbi:L,D-transpeptidase [Geomesophilobacter sediminis]|uniref:L,D-transpeptidase n=1 Tax=Geomesophilobacter sediminis TaxID=2798584 RepID=A0A8J7JD17_9BACT|nr:L,D-transpeptidase [Geomesophilobacter sediminis]MBJ6723264.1 L,D-transpeptidase [Geomesophilobacter sediminis]